MPNGEIYTSTSSNYVSPGTDRVIFTSSGTYCAYVFSFFLLQPASFLVQMPDMPFFSGLLPTPERRATTDLSHARTTKRRSVGWRSSRARTQRERVSKNWTGTFGAYCFIRFKRTRTFVYLRKDVLHSLEISFFMKKWDSIE